ncbi:MAG: hypothetical protein E6I09_00865 [Chloroflexi bacterium]|nr:MAG: hypothetical protein E6I09_00865 [Chloroflexota bacterium]
MHIQSIDGAPANERGGQKSYLLLTEGQFGSKNLAITWVEGAPGSMQAVHGHPDNEQIYVIVRGRGVISATSPPFDAKELNAYFAYQPSRGAR